MNQPTRPTDTMAAMTIREYYAGLAMQGFCSKNIPHGLGATDIATVAVQMADALIKQLNQPTS